MDICLLWVLCDVTYGSLRWADHSSRGILPNVVRRCEWSRNLINEESMARVGLQRHKKKIVDAGGSNYRYHDCRKNDSRRPWRMRQPFSSSRIDHVISCIKNECATDCRANNIREGALFYTVGRAVRGKARDYNKCLKQRTQLRSGNINKRGTYIVCVCVCVYTRFSTLQSGLLARKCFLFATSPFPADRCQPERGRL